MGQESWHPCHPGLPRICFDCCHLQFLVGENDQGFTFDVPQQDHNFIEEWNEMVMIIGKKTSMTLQDVNRDSFLARYAFYYIIMFL